MRDIYDPSCWQAFVDYRCRRGGLDERELRYWRNFIAAARYCDAGTHANDGVLEFSVPRRILVNKGSSGKKRVVYSFEPAENALLKMIAFLLYRYDGQFAANLYSFRRNIGAKQAIRALTAQRNIDSLWCYKLDVRDYFNSVDTDLLFPMLDGLLADDLPLLAFLRRLLSRDTARGGDGGVIHEKRGAMAGTPISPFLANVYLSGLDALFSERGITYARYSDDIIIFADSREKIEEYRRLVLRELARLKLSVNPDKESLSAPGEAWCFLGIEYRGGRLDIAPASLKKMKGKIRRKARALRRWLLRRGAGEPRAMAAFARSMNRKLFGSAAAPQQFCWSRWFFPLLNVSDRLGELDRYMQQCMRFVACGQHARSNYRVRYATLKRCGLRSLVNDYYRYRKKPDDYFPDLSLL